MFIKSLGSILVQERELLLFFFLQIFKFKTESKLYDTSTRLLYNLVKIYFIDSQ